MDPILALNNENNANLSISNSTAELSDLFALPEPFPTVLALLYSGTAFIAFVTNISAVIIIVKQMKISADLRKYLINLFATDLSMAIFSVPFNYTDIMYGYWRFPLFMCPFSQFITICSISSSIFTLTAIGIERYLAIVHPLKHCWWGGSHTNYIICTIWILSLLISSPLLYYTKAVPFNYSGLALFDCREEWEGELSSKIYTVILFVITFIVPFSSLTFFYGSIGFKTFKKVQPGERITYMEKVQNKTKIKVIKMLLILVFVFLVCWLPIQLFDLIIWCFPQLRYPESYTHYYIYFGLYFSCHLLSQFHTFMNPIINIFMSNNFKVSHFKSILNFRNSKSSSQGLSINRRNKIRKNRSDKSPLNISGSSNETKVTIIGSLVVRTHSMDDQELISLNCTI